MGQSYCHWDGRLTPRKTLGGEGGRRDLQQDPYEYQHGAHFVSTRTFGTRWRDLGLGISPIPTDLTTKQYGMTALTPIAWYCMYVGSTWFFCLPHLFGNLSMGYTVYDWAWHLLHGWRLHTTNFSDEYISINISSLFYPQIREFH